MKPQTQNFYLEIHRVEIKVILEYSSLKCELRFSRLEDHSTMQVSCNPVPLPQVYILTDFKSFVYEF